MGLLSKVIPSRRRGDRGEDAAARYLESRGLRVVERNWRHRQWELDLICRDRDTVVFVEVKTRRAGGLGSPADGLTRAKRARLVRAAGAYLTQHGLWDAPCRFDLAGVTDTGDSLDVEHIENAFDAEGLGPGW